MYETGTEIQMTKGYKGMRGVIRERTDSAFPLYEVELENGIRIVAGPTAFVLLQE